MRIADPVVIGEREEELVVLERLTIGGLKLDNDWKLLVKKLLGRCLGESSRGSITQRMFVTRKRSSSLN